jgi:hypothetical protein
MLRYVVLASALAAQLATVAIISIHIFIAQRLENWSTVKTLAASSTALEVITLLLVLSLSLAHVSPSWSKALGKRQLFSFGAGIFVCASATTSVATLVYLAQATAKPTADLGSIDDQQFLIGAALALGLSFAFQIIFLVSHAILSNAAVRHGQDAFDLSHGGRSTVKGLRYSQTLLPGYQRANSLDSRYAASTNGSVMSAGFPSRNSSYKSKMVVTKERRLDTPTDEDSSPSSSTESVEQWDACTTVLEIPRGRFLETIPASPASPISRTSISSLASELEPPPPVQRSRSYSPVAGLRERSERVNSSSSELHIHPLFRSDSTTPPPLATPGTVVLAAPNAGQVIAHRESIRSIRRLRSGSSPLSRPGSGDHSRCSSLRRPMNERDSIREDDEAHEAEDEIVPAWVLGGIETGLSPNRS